MEYNEEEVLTRGQELLIVYLKEIGMSLAETMYFVMLVWEEEATIEMLKYLLETHNTDISQLFEIATKLSIKYPLRDGDEDYDD